MAIAFAVILPTGLLTWSPGRPDQGQVVTPVDVDTILNYDARGLDFPIRNPQMPEGWEANSARRQMITGEMASRVGWVIKGKQYMAVVQTSASAEDVARGVDSKVRNNTGSKETQGTTWAVYQGEDADTLWVTDLGDVRIGLVGTTGDTEFFEAADAILKAEPLVVPEKQNP